MNLPSCLWTETGRTLYSTIMKVSDGTIWNGSTFESFTVANYANYVIAATETPSASYRYVSTWPVGITAVGDYIVRYFRRVTGTATVGVDACVYEQWVGFDGSMIVQISDIDIRVDDCAVLSLAR